LKERRHAAIMFTDIVGYTTLMGKDEDKAFEILKQNHSIHKTLINNHNGTLIKEIGDGTLASFPLASNAVRCAIDIQKEANEQNIPLKIGVHEGEMVFSGGDVLGDGVNIASRLQESAQKGCINISEAVYRDVKNLAGIYANFVEDRKYKNVDDPIKVYMVCGEEADVKKYPTALPNKDSLNSIAVLPFANMSNDPDQEYFCDGITEEIINELTHIKSLKVIARTSAFMFKGKHKDMREIGRKLDVLTLLEGSVRKAGNRIRITAQLIKVSDGSHLWAERYDRTLEDIFDIQDEISLAIAENLKVNLLGREKEVMVKRYTNNLEAYNQYLRALYDGYLLTLDGTQRALKSFELAINLDPNFCLAYYGLGGIYNVLGMLGAISPDQSLSKAKGYIKKAIDIDESLGEAHSILGHIYLYWEFKWEKAEEHIRKGLILNPNSASTHFFYTTLLTKKGLYNDAIYEAKRAQEIDPLAPLYHHAVGVGYMVAKKYDEALKAFNLNISKFPNFYWSHNNLGLTLEQCNKISEAGKELEKALNLSNGDPVIMAHLISFYFSYGAEDKAEELFKLLKKKTQQMYVFPHVYGIVHLAQGKYDLVFEWFERAYNEHDYWLIHFLGLQIPRYSLPDEPRFRKLIKKIGMKESVANFASQ